MKIFITLIFCLYLQVTFGQTRDTTVKLHRCPPVFSRKNSIQFEAFGHGLFYSLDYERIIINDYHFKLSGQLGFAVYPYSDQIDLWLPVSVNYIKAIGYERKHHAEFGISHILRYDQLYNYAVSNPWQAFLGLKAGYRFQKPDGRWLFKIQFTPFGEYYKTKLDDILPSGTLGTGYTF